MKMSALLFFLAISCGHAVSAADDDDDCDVDCDQTEPTFHEFGESLEFVFRCSFLFKNMSPECVAAACPQLTTVCPFNSDGSLNPEALARLGPILTSCIQTQKVICGVNIGHIPIKMHAYTTATLIDPSLAKGTCATNPNASYVQYLNSAIFEFPADQNCGSGPITLRMNVPFFNYQGGFTCNFSLPAVRAVPFLKPLTQMTFPDMVGQANYTLTPVVVIDRSKFEVQSLNATASVGAKNFSFLGVCLPQALVDVFNTGASAFFKNSTAGVSAVRFLSTFVTSGIQAANRSCASNN